MKRTQSFSLYALLIALLVHIIVILLLMLLPKPIPPIPPKEARFKLSLSEYPNYQAPTVRNIMSNPIPHHTQPNRIIHTQISIPIPLESTPQIVEPKLTVTIPVAPVEKVPTKKPSGLYDILSRPDGSASTVSTKNSARVSNDINELYGDKFNELSKEEKQYIEENLDEIGRIGQRTLNRIAEVKFPDGYNLHSNNLIEFYLYPDGSISEIRFLKHGQSSLVDDVTRMTIETSFHKFPRPRQKTLIHYNFIYSMY